MAYTQLPFESTNIDNNENFLGLFEQLNFRTANHNLTKINTTDSYSMTGSTKETQIDLRKQYFEIIKLLITQIVDNFKDKLLLPEHLAYVFDKFVEFYIISRVDRDDPYVQLNGDFIDPHFQYQPFEYFYYHLRKLVPDLKIGVETIDKIAGGIQFNQISHTTINARFIDTLLEEERLSYEKTINRDLLEALQRLKRIIKAKVLTIEKKKRLDKEFLDFLLEP